VTTALTAFTRGRVVPIDGPVVDGGTVLVRAGRIEAVGAGVAVPDGTEVVDCAGRWVLPGFLDAHVHLVVHEEGEGRDGNDTGELTDPSTPQVRALDAVNPADVGFADALAAGVLAVNVNPGSGNAIGGQTVALRCWGRTVEEMLLRAPSGMKSALGENPKRTYGDKGRLRSTRLGTAAVIRTALAAAADYDAKRRLDDEGRRPDRDLGLEALAMVLRREIPWRQNCHRADDIATALRLTEEFGYDLGAGPRHRGAPASRRPRRARGAGADRPLMTSRSRWSCGSAPCATPGCSPRSA